MSSATPSLARVMRWSASPGLAGMADSGQLGGFGCAVPGEGGQLAGGPGQVDGFRAAPACGGGAGECLPRRLEGAAQDQVGYGFVQHAEGDDELVFVSPAGGPGEGLGDRRGACFAGFGGEGSVLPAQYGSGEPVVVAAVGVLHDPPVGEAGERGAQRQAEMYVRWGDDVQGTTRRDGRAQDVGEPGGECDDGAIGQDDRGAVGEYVHAVAEYVHGGWCRTGHGAWGDVVEAGVPTTSVVAAVLGQVLPPRRAVSRPPTEPARRSASGSAVQARASVHQYGMSGSGTAGAEEPFGLSRHLYQEGASTETSARPSGAQSWMTAPSWTARTSRPGPPA